MGGAAHSRVVLIASLAGILFGFDTAVIAGVTHALREIFGLSPVALGVAVSSALWGTLLGALIAGRPGDRYGSRDMLRLVGLLYAVSSLGSALAWDLSAFVACRFLAGIAIGASSVLAPVYLAEIAPANRRGALVGLFQLNIVIGILLAYGSNFLVGQSIAGPDAWRYKLAVSAVPAAIFFVLLFTIPHSPRWLVAKARIAEAEMSLRRLGCADPRAALGELSSARDSQNALHRRLSWSRHRRPILLAVGLACFNQLSGINAVLYYLGDIFAAAGFDAWSADLQSVAVGATNLIATLVGIALLDRVGRRTLILLGSVGTAFSLAGVAFIMSGGAQRSWLLPLLVLFIASFAISQGAVIWVYLSEIFPTGVRARGQGLGSATHWILNALISGTFPIIAALSKAAPFAFFACMMALQFIAALLFMPETRGVALENMHAALRAPLGGATQRNM
ncbi:MAG TPA: sugar porter family MFS transporter [Steroidobacteraceae bacterium]|jgi:sugar porter (SP) family MFS transporter|nr:sugar porter family MFS transporter [Steroidobacteraceae bacterium]